MATSEPRIPPLPESEWKGDAAELLERFRRGGPADGAILNIFRTLARHPKLLKRWTVFGNHVLFKSTLPPRDRELLILRIGWLCRCEYEWGQHVVIARQAGVDEEEIRRVIAGPDDPAWEPFESDLLRAVDELHRDARISETTWARLADRYDVRQMLDLVFTVGQYTLVSMVLNSCGVELDQGVHGFPEDVA